MHVAIVSLEFLYSVGRLLVPRPCFTHSMDYSVSTGVARRSGMSPIILMLWCALYEITGRQLAKMGTQRHIMSIAHVTSLATGLVLYMYIKDC